MSKYPAPKQHGATAEYKTFAINNRRYLGNKYKLLPFISRVVDEECPGVESVADIFAGTGAVASAFLKKQVFTNDLLYSNYICNLAWFGSQPYSKEKLVEYIGYYNMVAPTGENYMTANFSNTFFSRADCAKIGFIREDIEEKFRLKKLNQRERALLITALLYAMDKIANTCGHYDAYIQGAQYDKPLELSVPMAEEHNQTGNKCYNTDANKLVRRLKADLVYIDPPYNSRQYSDAYHVLENVARWEKPEVHGVARKMDRTALKSDYCTQKATDAFEDLIQHIDAKYILFSYNNMATKGNDRSNAKITDDDIMRILGAKGQVSVFTADYKAFSAGMADVEKNEERLFLCKCTSKETRVSSPLNYTGGKSRLLSQLIPRFPSKVGAFVDLFCGGGNVGLNAPCQRVILNDLNPSLLGLFETFRRLGGKTVLHLVESTIERYGLSQSDKYGYPHYGCTNSAGLGSYNRLPYEALRADFNTRTEKDDAYYIELYVLIVFAFNNQIRFNSRGEFNLPVGKRDFNSSMRGKLSAFIDALGARNCDFSSVDFRDFDTSKLTEEDFVYLDPPYLITCATYNENGGWDEKDELDLLAFLDTLHERHIRFALSNVLRSKGKENKLLLDWLARNEGKYRAIHLRHSYANSSYQVKDKTSVTEEVLIVNYKEVISRPQDKLSYKSFCWSFGTTSFRTQNFNRRIEEQLGLLSEFWSTPEHRDAPWEGNNPLHASYYRFMKKKAFVAGDADRKDKDGREKTSGLVQIGLVSNERRLTPAGELLLDMSQKSDFTPDNPFGIPKDSFLYLKQLLKTSCKLDTGLVRPLIVLLYILSKVDTLTMDEFTNLLPLCVNEAITTAMPEKIKAIRAGSLQTDDVILEALMSMSNYQQALELFLNNDVDEALICKVGINRKSRNYDDGKAYDKAYYPLYLAFKKWLIEKDIQGITELHSASQSVTTGTLWRALLFNSTSSKAIAANPTGHLKDTAFLTVQNEQELKELFFKTMHLFKAKKTLHDYCDLNERYLRSTDILLFEDNTVKLDTIPEQFFLPVADKLYRDAFSPCPLLAVDCSLIDISPCLEFNEKAILKGISLSLGRPLATMDAAKSAMNEKRYDRFKALIDTKFTDKVLLRLLELFEARKGNAKEDDKIDKKIGSLVTDNADAPTIFEYILGIIWYKVSDRSGTVLDYMKLSLDADLLPKTHAKGGDSDIVYKYAATVDYPAHALLLEATLAKSTGQRSMEMEPVSRHLGQRRLYSGNDNDFCIFITNKLNINVISDFQGRKNMTWYDTGDYSRCVTGLKIIPLATEELKAILRRGLKYPALYRLCEEAYNSDLPAPEWYKTCIKAPLTAV